MTEHTLHRKGEICDSCEKNTASEVIEKELSVPVEMDDEDCERRRSECLDEMSDLEKQFMDLKEKLFKERLNQVKAKLEEVIAGTATEYIEPVAALQKNMKIRTEVAGVYRDLCLQVIHNKYDCEMQGARQHMEVLKMNLKVIRTRDYDFFIYNIYIFISIFYFLFLMF
ncbi:UNVERIFIED_CONTAM: hypothetical protein FKN15_027261 [Acipenser sinensis]